MVTLLVLFRNEIVDVLDGNKCIHIYDTKDQDMLGTRKKFEANINIDKLIEELKALCDLENKRLTTTEEEANQITLSISLGEDTTTDIIEDVYKRQLYRCQGKPLVCS